SFNPLQLPGVHYTLVTDMLAAKWPEILCGVAEDAEGPVPPQNNPVTFESDLKTNPSPNATLAPQLDWYDYAAHVIEPPHNTCVLHPLSPLSNVC
ncbi:MAG: hypothetical protein ACOYET_04485, partial [Bacillota bacterium]